jgi:tRNA(His) 5'-end guanylyltransferase
MGKDSFGDRMKGYEAVSDYRLPPRVPVLLRIDGNSFSKLTTDLQLKKPFDVRFDNAMEAAALAVLKYTAGLVAYIQSDEITVLLRNDRAPGDTPFLANRIQKICSLTASTAAIAFWKELELEGLHPNASPVAFDCRAFVVPESDVNNAFLWRQRDAFKNCVGAYAYYGLAAVQGKKPAEQRLHKLSTNERQELLFTELGINVNDLPVAHRRGRAVVRSTMDVPIEEVLSPEKLTELRERGHIVSGSVQRSSFAVDREVPDFHLVPTYIESLLL